MANTFFQFKQFIVHQKFCAMKVSTDACIFGATVAEVFAERALKATGSITNYLDIGTGTGLLSLMLAQKTTAFIDAVEIDIAAYKQAKENFAASVFKERFAIYNTDVLHFTSNKIYEGIVCNPPFFEGDLLSPDKKKNAAKHNTTLTLQQLLKIAGNSLQENGLLAVLLPHHRVDEFEKNAATLSFYLHKKILLQHTLQHPYCSVILFLSKIKAISTTKELVIKNKANTYTAEFVYLLKDYYLHL